MSVNLTDIRNAIVTRDRNQPLEQLCSTLVDQFESEFMRFALEMNDPKRERPWVTLCHGQDLSAYLLGWRSDCKSDHGTDDVGLHGHGDSKVYVCCLYGTIGHTLCYGRPGVRPELDFSEMKEGDKAALPVGALHNMCGTTSCTFGVSLHIYQPGLLRMEFCDYDDSGRLVQTRTWSE